MFAGLYLIIEFYTNIVILCSRSQVPNMALVMIKYAECLNLQFPALREFVQMGKPVWGTCAGLIFLANKATGGLFLSKVLNYGQQSQLRS